MDLLEEWPEFNFGYLFNLFTYGLQSLLGFMGGRMR